MSSGGKVPDVVPRAAARIRDVGPPKPVDQIRAGKVERPDTPVILPSGMPSDLRSPTQPQRKTVNVSPTSLAANGIFLPSAGNVRTVEQFRVIKRHVLANVEAAVSTGSHPNRVLMVTSARPGEGKTYTAINLALSIAAERDYKVLLIDADVYRQCILNYLGIKAEVGWIDYLSGTGISFSDILLHTNVANLSVLPAGNSHSEVPELMSSQIMSQFVIELVQRYPDRFIIFDGLPCLVSSEPAILARVVGQAVFVVAAHETSRDQVEIFIAPH